MNIRPSQIVKSPELHRHEREELKNSISQNTEQLIQLILSEAIQYRSFREGHISTRAMCETHK